jgi:hypothetical protein
MLAGISGRTSMDSLLSLSDISGLISSTSSGGMGGTEGLVIAGGGGGAGFSYKEVVSSAQRTGNVRSEKMEDGRWGIPLTYAITTNHHREGADVVRESRDIVTKLELVVCWLGLCLAPIDWQRRQRRDGGLPWPAGGAAGHGHERWGGFLACRAQTQVKLESMARMRCDAMRWASRVEPSSSVPPWVARGSTRSV